MQLTVRDVANLLQASEPTVYRWIREEGIPAYRVNDQYRFHRVELLEWATARRIGVPADLFREPAQPSAGLAGLAEALLAGGIVHGLPGTDTESVLRAAVEAMALPPDADREQLLRVLIAREEQASTGIGDGIAIPHVRNPIVLRVERSTATLCFLERPVDFRAPDGQPVRCLFTLVSPTVRAHLHLLSRLSFALRDPGVRAVIRRQGPRDDILAEVRRVESSLPPPPAATP